MRRALPLALVVCGGLAGCGDDNLNLASPSPDLSMPDLVPPEDLAPYPDLVPSLGVGLPCPLGNGCMPGLICVGPKLQGDLPPDGYCTRTCLNDPDCGAGAFCGPSVGTMGNLCWLRCGANDTCAQPKQVCGRRLGGFIDLVNKACVPGNATARDGAPCKTFGDCNRNQACVNNPFDFPGGVCVTIGCTVGDNTTCAPGGAPLCIKVDKTNACFPTCGADGDCRINEGYKCLQPQGFPQKVCVFNNPLGSNCTKAPPDCNGGSPWTCIVDNNVPNGLCTIVGCDPKKNTGCPTNGACVDVGGGTGICLKQCGGNGECAKGLSCKQVPTANGPAMACAP